ncbi:FG-GAP-like repeat-containing protein [Planctomyces sp. SH-PL62]|uniref:FG-GAP-like repeat-containing protein n=1 Tax=Planctomyces sp. SH-PL62 TaxID=1636152 RepID=UPI00078D90C8|nr:FG-GAP-like repeat-containing protein [Planctomyces sp. SH-PL62]AMV38364.1 Tetratricopeptide repeat protein [Planctomyces sp. SH-PL62]
MSRRKAWAAGLALVIVLLPLVAWIASRRGGLPGPGTPRYEEMVSAFSTGVAALDTEANPIARDALTRAVRLVPEEPAAWANLALAQIRLGELDQAAEALQKARALAPDSGAVDRLLALLEQRRGEFELALDHLKHAVLNDPKDLRSRYSLAQEYERQGDDADGAARELDAILEVAPDNLAALIDRARVAAKLGDVEAMKGVVDRLEGPSGAWPSRAREQYESLKQAVADGNLRLATTRGLMLRNVLVTTPDFRRSLDALTLPTGTVGEPLHAFLRLPQAPTASAPPDRSTAFEVAPSTGGAKSDAVFLLPDPEGGPATVLEADGRELRKADGSGVVAPFPGGEGGAPSPHAVVAADWNSDYRVDLVLAGPGGVRILRGEDDGSFVDVSEAAHLAPDVRDADAYGVWAADVELDGDVDFVVGLRSGPTLVLRNGGDGGFETIRPFDSVADLRDFAWADLDGDGDPDAALLDARGRLHVLDNERAGRFQARTLPDGLADVSALAVADLDGLGAIDLALLGPSSVLRLSDRDDGAGWDLVEAAPRAGVAAADPGSARLLIADLDNNGGMDMVASGPGSTLIWLEDGAGGFVVLDGPPSLRPLAAADLDGDGRIDLAGLADEGRSARALGRGTADYAWQAILPRAAKAVGDGRINSFGVGGEVQVRAGLLVRTQVVAGPVVHFGLGTHARADVARVVWPNGTSQAEFDVEANRTIVAEQRLKGSCPFVYAFDGEEVRFVTDFLWRSPLGLRINAQDTAGVSQTEDRIKIRGDQLAAREGEYDVRVTAELWETHYWDHISLMVVDHPEETEIHIDERFARKPPTLEVRVTDRPVAVASAVDDQGRDVTDVVRARDGRYLDTFGRGFYQGVTRDHWVEVDLGEAPPGDRKLVLVAEGWIHPTDSSINVALGQGRHEPPKGLSLEAPTAAGDWAVVRDDLGFPAGKSKTILIDLDGVFQPGAPRKLRLRTNLEVFWDALSVASYADPAVLKSKRLAPTSADLRWRGYSLMTQADQSSPETPRYDIVTSAGQRWNDLAGFYTRFGDVRELLERVDDRYMIVNAGDELALRFPAPDPPPPGWRRDFVLIGDGWNKDGDYNTAFSKTVLPLPSHARPAYDEPPGELEDDPIHRAHREDWERYHTRFVTPHVFREGLRPRTGAIP